ncbi:MAG: pantoate--beta-alanine ligase [Pseudomonadota bacterium]
MKADSGVYSVETKEQLRQLVEYWRSQNQKIALVPTMGFLHKGHLSLVTIARQYADRVITSIFVNPKQFSPTEDFDAYPRNADEDLAALAAANCDAVYLPSAEEIYPFGFQTSVSVNDLAGALCGVSRPHFFGGVATVVTKLLNQCRPDVAVFGEKDFQQLKIIERLNLDLDLGVEIIGGPIVREADGLAMSSRNAYLSPSERKIAGRLNVALAQAAKDISTGNGIDDAVHRAQRDLVNAGFDAVDYLEVRHESDLSLAGPGALSSSARIFAAAQIGRTRLIDNWPISISTERGRQPRG